MPSNLVLRPAARKEAQTEIQAFLEERNPSYTIEGLELIVLETPNGYKYLASYTAKTESPWGDSEHERLAQIVPTDSGWRTSNFDVILE